MNLSKFFSELVGRNPKAVMIGLCFILIGISASLGILKYHDINNILSDPVSDFILWVAAVLAIISVSLSVALIPSLIPPKPKVSVDGDSLRTYNEVLDDLNFAIDSANKENRILKVSLTNLGVQLKTQTKSSQFDEYIKKLDRGIKDGEIFCRFLFLAYDRESADRIIREAKSFENDECYEIKVILDNNVPVLPIYNIYTFGSYAGKLSIENPRNHIISIHANGKKDSDTLSRIQDTFERSWSVDEAKYLLNGGRIINETLTLLEKEKFD